MLLPRTHTWTPAQRWLIIAVVASALVSISTLVYSYERYHRGPSDTVLYGTWKALLFGDFYLLEFDPDRTFSISLSSAPGRGEEVTNILKGRWYGGGSNIYLRVTEDNENPPQARRPIILHIVDIQPNELRVRIGRDVQSYKRVNLVSPPASNKSSQPPSGPRDDQI